VIACGGTRVLLDCGFSMRETVARLSRLGVEADDITAILVTHEHSDHINGVGALARRYKLPVYLTTGTRKAANGVLGALPETREFSPHAPFAIGDLAVEPFPVPHDAREPAQFVFGDGSTRLGYLTDVGISTAHIEQSLGGCDALVLECNHDLEMLEEGPYPAYLKERIKSDHGHLDNHSAARLAERLDRSRLKRLVAAHLSQTNNTPSRARRALADALGCVPGWVEVANQETGLGWRSLADGWV
jgi:phosphoribosyl 1,2-cyclic phosphodiesterase